MAYDPQAPPEITEDNESEYEGVYLDNVLSSTFTPGSIFKIVTSAAAIENIPDLYDRTWVCNGSENIGGSEVTCTETHGTLTYKEAMAHSCNIVFAKLAVELGSDTMTKLPRKSALTAPLMLTELKPQKVHMMSAMPMKTSLAGRA